MNSMRCSLLALAGLLSLSPGALAQSTDLERLAACLTGFFTTAEQASRDPNFRDVTLHVARIWRDRTDGPWLYVEQALAIAPDHPYRQRVYQLAASTDGVFESRVFELPDPVAATFAWKNPGLLSKLGPTELIPRSGCTVYLRAQPDGSFKGGTEGHGCQSVMRGASYATSEATITEKQTISWDRGYNSSGTQVWGSTDGGYVFQRQ